MTQEQVAKRIGVGAKTLRTWFRGEEPKAEKEKRLVKALGLSRSFLHAVREEGPNLSDKSRLYLLEAYGRVVGLGPSAGNQFKAILLPPPDLAKGGSGAELPP